jgi:2-polyprenyl-3-methyl-5-hydroxy-6-metoxy-1,4-benzoquinol methylase
MGHIPVSVGRLVGTCEEIKRINPGELQVPGADLGPVKRAEADYFDHCVIARTQLGNIPAEADMRRATRSIPQVPGQPHFDPQIARILDGCFRERFIDWVAHRPRGRVLEVGCGPGWLALELGRRGQTVDAYDISPQAIALAKRMLAENPYRDGFGEVNYHLQDVTEVDLGYERYDAVSGWSAFHHLPNLPEFMERVWHALKPGGILATSDDMPQRFVDKLLGWTVYAILPNYYMTYPQKIKKILRVMLGTARITPEVLTPMEQGKHASVHEIADIWQSPRFELIENVRFNSFAGQMMVVRGPAGFRYPITRVLVGLDRLLCRIGVCQGFVRIMIARKK